MLIRVGLLLFKNKQFSTNLYLSSEIGGVPAALTECISTAFCRAG